MYKILLFRHLKVCVDVVIPSMVSLIIINVYYSPLWCVMPAKLKNFYIDVYVYNNLLCLWYTERQSYNCRELYNINISLSEYCYSAFISDYYCLHAGSCVNASYTGCCDVGQCRGLPEQSYCYCDMDCYQHGDCCSDIEQMCPNSPCMATPPLLHKTILSGIVMRNIAC